MDTPQSEMQLRMRLLWMLVCALISLLVALVAGIVKANTGGGLGDAVLTGGATFATSMGLCLGIMSAVRSR
ncbi:hypothetical protein CDO52_01740 [Nocardiopsis gilva YIM 90087]|uniref:Uncharacterized protein n=1 Tax=Nocardiopsis gilva YIM 90087 TaxID=1235441 RepID=A0A223S0L9_9ACTN|nr:hypothetical protein [Nocardiopsis gilva]ASU81685.1 hypothetical protein CDO52_01740 [Nocardiopsis gilva YIM 90087]